MSELQAAPAEHQRGGIRPSREPVFASSEAAAATGEPDSVGSIGGGREARNTASATPPTSTQPYATADGARSRSAIIATPKPALHKKHERCETAGASNLRDLLLDISKGAVRSPSSLTADPRLFFMKHYISLPAVKQPAGRQRRRK
eukprot:g4615.t2